MRLHRNIQEAILSCLKEIFVEKKYADKVIERTLKSNPKWGGRDRRFIAEATYDIVRWYRLLKYMSDAANYDFDKMLSVYYSAEGNMLNMLIKKAETDGLSRQIKESIPDWMNELGTKELGEEKWAKEIHALNEPAKVVLRVNTLKTTKEELIKTLLKEDIHATTIENFPDTLVLNKRKNVFAGDSFKQGLFEIQDASSQLVAPFLHPEEGMRVIDACAGAGGKTLHIGMLMNSTGKIIALDTEEWKLQELKKRARRASLLNIETRIIDSGKAVKRLENSCDRLLLDVPCSGLGVLRRNPDAKWKLSLEFIERIRGVQQKILTEYSCMVKKGGIMVYSTCSILPSENQHQVEWFISESQNKFEILEEKHIYPSSGFDGFYMAKIRKK